MDLNCVNYIRSTRGQTHPKYKLNEILSECDWERVVLWSICEQDFNCLSGSEIEVGLGKSYVYRGRVRLQLTGLGKAPVCA